MCKLTRTRQKKVFNSSNRISKLQYFSRPKNPQHFWSKQERLTPLGVSQRSTEMSKSAYTFSTEMESLNKEVRYLRAENRKIVEALKEARKELKKYQKKYETCYDCGDKGNADAYAEGYSLYSCEKCNTFHCMGCRCECEVELDKTSSEEELEFYDKHGA